MPHQEHVSRHAVPPNRSQARQKKAIVALAQSSARTFASRQLGATARFITAQHLANQLGRSSTSMGVSGCCDRCWRATLVLDELGYLTGRRSRLSSGSCR